jgi:uncharacterized FlaG/YvyC family protein
MDVLVGPVGHQGPSAFGGRLAPTPSEGDRQRVEPLPLALTPADRKGDKDTQPTIKAVAAAANTIADFLDKKISFTYDERINQVIVKVVRESTEEVIRQLPPKELVELMAKMRESFTGLILDQKG